MPTLDIRELQITWDDLKAAETAVGEFGGDNRAGIQGTLHRISALRNRKGTVVGLTCRVGRAVTGASPLASSQFSHPVCVIYCLKIQLYTQLLLSGYHDIVINCAHHSRVLEFDSMS